MPKESDDLSTLGELGESAVLGRIFPRLPAASAQLLGPGDDAAVVAAADGRFVVTTDLMVHGPDFRLAWSLPHDLGWKAAASNLSDVAAMGAVPTALVVAIAAPADSPISLLEGIADGFRDACGALAPGCGIVGGDLSVSDTLTIAVTAFGDLAGRPPVLRSGARPGDVVAVSGALGEAAAGLRVLFAEALDANGAPDAVLASLVRDRTTAQLTPSPPIADGPLAASAGATSMVDLSDGLAIDASRVARASGVRIDFDRGALGADPDLALGGGEDHSLLATFPPGARLPGGFRPIGTVVAPADDEGNVSVILLDGKPYTVSGWDPYTGWKDSGVAGGSAG
ncbi:thiamine-monophosphate kinase [Cryobacterium mesophilum]|uniref:Thiamine-monophosphate kinase n=1 Tax=Terrimesophilobacter mesophilus TaxID=433647 RepID=A0A4R8VBF7_9MICO|nr:thiamine-phosphate kinase [Terrimesophilobacter mesophilus]MBB5632550.1 thiamine-monophosphate kinase [Terrimesophilobacter mesophilus]TFB79372.1 thiamine-phosphate kinase [Terrimesophilobacter mesophilus]